MPTKATFVAIAEIISSRKTDTIDRHGRAAAQPVLDVLDDLAGDFAHRFSRENPNFDAIRFLFACESPKE